MQKKVAFHFHGYQPGDLVLREDGPWDEPQRFKERLSPVSLKVGDEVVEGKNWTQANLRSYVQTKDLFRSIPKGNKISLDIEPFTFQMLLRTDKQAFDDTVELLRDKRVKAVDCVMFHPILPHMDRCERGVLLGATKTFFEAIRKPEITGMWYPETVYEENVVMDTLETYKRPFYLIMDRRQFMFPQSDWAFWSLNYIIKDAIWGFGRNNDLSDAFAFGQRSPQELASDIINNKTDFSKEKDEVPYLITMASDLESLLSHPTRIENFRALLKELNKAKISVISHGEFIKKKKSGEFKAFKGEGGDLDFHLLIKEYSSWSDYFDLARPNTSDTRWTGVKRLDGCVVARDHCQQKVSQIWKQAFMLMTQELNELVRRHTERIIRSESESNICDIRALLTDYHRFIFRDYYIALGVPKEELDIKTIICSRLKGACNIKRIALALRAYYNMLQGNRSCPRFWENIDTRVTFQSVMFMSYALSDLIKAYAENNDMDAQNQVFTFYQDRLLNFENLYLFYNLGMLSGETGWESSDMAWIRAVQSEIPDISQYNVIKRAALLVGIRDLPKELLKKVYLSRAEIIADTAHIDGEAHGQWENPKWCQHKQ